MNNILSIIQQVFSGQILGGEMPPMALLHKVYEKAKSMNSTVIYGGLNLKMSVLANEYVAETQPTIEKIPNLLSAILEKLQTTNSKEAADIIQHINSRMSEITAWVESQSESNHPSERDNPSCDGNDGRQTAVQDVQFARVPKEFRSPLYRSLLAPDMEVRYRIVLQATQQYQFFSEETSGFAYVAEIDEVDQSGRVSQKFLREIPRGKFFEEFVKATDIFREIRDGIIKNDLFLVSETTPFSSDAIATNSHHVYRTTMLLRQYANSPRCILSRLERTNPRAFDQSTGWIATTPQRLNRPDGESLCFPETLLTLYSSYDPSAFNSENLSGFRDIFFENGLPKSAIEHLMDHILLSGYTYNSLMERISTIYRTDLRKFECLATAKSPDYNQCFDAVAYLAKNKAYGKEYAFFKRNINTHMEESFRLMNYIAMTHEIPRIVRTLSLLLQEVKTSRALVTQQTKLEDALFQS